MKRVLELMQLYQVRGGEFALAARATVAKQGSGGTGYFYQAAGSPTGSDLSAKLAEIARCERSGVERIVYTSSVATFDLRAGGLADETRHLPETEAIGAYKRSKIIAEDLVADMVARDRLPAVIVNPSTPIGPRDVKPTPTGRIIIEAASGRMPAFVETGLNFVHVDDVAAGHLAALQRGRIGERYILGGENMSLRQALLDIAGIVGRRARPLRLPRGAVYPFAFGAEMLARATGRLVEAIEWFIQAGYMKRPRNMIRP